MNLNLKVEIVTEMVKEEIKKKYKVNSRIANLIINEAIEKMMKANNLLDAAMNLMKMESELNELFKNIETIKNFEKLLNM